MGMLYGAFLSVWATVVFVLVGPTVFEERGATLPMFIALYLTAGAISGALIAILLPLWKSTIGSIVLGWAVAIPIAILIRVAAIGLHDWTLLDVELIAIAALAGGTTGARAARQALN